MVEPFSMPVLAGELGKFDFEARDGKLWLNGKEISRKTIASIHEATHLVIVASDLQKADIRRSQRA